MSGPAYRLHHVGVLVADIAVAADRYTRRFGYSVASSAIVDTVQTAEVQFLHLPGADHWLELVTPHGETSKLRNLLTKGIVLHHLCYEVDQLDEALEHLRAGGMLVVGAPASAVAFGGRRIAWAMDDTRQLVELVETGPGPLTLASLAGEA